MALYILLLLYVDYTIITSDNQLLSRLIVTLAMEFIMKDLGPLSYFLDIKVIPYDDELFLAQAKYALETLTKKKMLQSKYVNTLLAVNRNLHLNKTS